MQSTIKKLESIAEEFCVVTILPNLKKDIDINFSFICAEDGSIEVKVLYNGEKINYFDSDDTVSIKILKNEFSDIKYHYDENIKKNIVTGKLI